MAILGKVLEAPLKALGIISTPSQQALAPLPVSTRDDAAAQIATNDDLRRRQGGAADIINGSAGVQPAVTGGKLTLGS